MRSRNDLIGRADEYAILRTLVDDVRSGVARLALIEGEAGIGKTRLAAEITDYAHAKGLTVLQGAASELEWDRPFRLILDALDAPKEVRPERTTLAGLLAAAPDASKLISDYRYLIVDAIEDVVEHQAMERPVLIVAEDVHWADPSSLRALYALARRDDLPLLLVLTTRPLPRSDDLQQLIHELTEAGHTHLQLTGLTHPDVTEFAATRLGARPGPALTSELNRAGGNPLFLLELIDALGEEHMITTHDDEAEIVSAPEPPPSLRALILRRLGFLSTKGLDLLSTASVLGESFSASDLATTSGASLKETLSVLDEAITAGFVSGGTDSFSFRHDVVREALYEDLNHAVRRGMHLHIARSLAASGAPPTQVAHHVALGAEFGDREAIAWLRDAALEIAPRAPGIAADLLCKAGALLPPGDIERTILLLPAVRQLWLSGRLREGEQLAENVALEVRGTPAMYLLKLERINLLISELRLDAVESELAEVLSDPELPASFRPVFIAIGAGSRLSFGDLSGARARLAGIAELATADPASLPGGVFHCVQGLYHLICGEFTEAVGWLEVALPGTEFFSAGRAHGLLLFGAALCSGDRLETARRTLEEARVDLEHRGMVGYLIEHHWLSAGVHFAAGRWDDALAEVEAATDLTADTAILGAGNFFADPAALVHLLRGDPVAANAAADAIGEEPTVLRSGVGRAWRDPVRALVQNDLGARAQALQTIQDWQRSCLETDVVPDLRTIGRSVARICREHGDDVATEQLRAFAREALERADGVRSVESAAQVVLGAIAGDVDTLLAAVDSGRAGERPFELAEACAEAGVALLTRGDDTGRALVDEAFSIYQTLRARRQEALLAQDVRPLGVRRGSRRKRRGVDRGWDALTESERRVVALVREGLTNGEIGARLFISKGTVATHLRSVFRKIGVTSRAELAAAATRHSI